MFAAIVIIFNDVSLFAIVGRGARVFVSVTCTSNILAILCEPIADVFIAFLEPTTAIVKWLTNP